MMRMTRAAKMRITCNRRDVPQMCFHAFVTMAVLIQRAHPFQCHCPELLLNSIDARAHRSDQNLERLSFLRNIVVAVVVAGLDTG